MPNDYIYENAPLIEVIAEIHWVLQPLTAIPDGAVDPFYNPLRDNLASNLGSQGFKITEKLTPDELPLELMAHRPVVRYRTDTNAWPLYQLGPGIFTVNIVPPYKGWNVFRSVLEQGIQSLFTSHPNSKELLKLERVELHYIDGFTQRHGLDSYGDFVKQNLRINIELPDEITKMSLVDGKVITPVCEVRLPVKEPANSFGAIKISPGKVSDEQAAITEFFLRTAPNTTPQTVEEILTWFDQAHSTVREWFQHLTNDEIKTKMGPAHEIKS